MRGAYRKDRQRGVYQEPERHDHGPPALVLGHVDDDIGLAKQIIRHDPASIHPEECAMTIRMSDGGISDDVVVDGCGCDERSSHQIVGGP